MAQVVAKSPNNISETLLITKLPDAIKDSCRKSPEIPKRDLIKIARMRSEAGQINTFNKLTKKKSENEEPKNEEQSGKENYKLTLGFIKSLTSKLNKSNIAITSDEEKANMKNQLELLSGAINNYMDKSGLR